MTKPSDINRIDELLLIDDEGDPPPCWPLYAADELVGVLGNRRICAAAPIPSA